MGVATHLLVLALAAVCLGFAYPREWFTLGHEEEEEEALDLWVSAIRPFDPWPATNSFLDDDLTPAQWEAKLAALVSDLDVDPDLEWEEEGRVPKVVVAASVERVAASLGLQSGPVHLVRSWRSFRTRENAEAQSASRVWAWDTVACFYRPGKPRGWCARLRFYASLLDPAPEKWDLRVLHAESAGVILESELHTLSSVHE